MSKFYLNLNITIILSCNAYNVLNNYHWLTCKGLFIIIFIYFISIIAVMIIEMCSLWLVEDCVISCYNHLARGDYSRGSKFQNAASHFVNVRQEEINMIKQTAGLKHTKDVVSLAKHYSKEKKPSFYQLNQMNLSNSSGNWLILVQEIKSIITEQSTKTKNLQLNSKSPELAIILNSVMLSKYCWIISLTLSQGLFNNVHFALSK